MPQFVAGVGPLGPMVVVELCASMMSHLWQGWRHTQDLCHKWGGGFPTWHALPQ